MFSEIDDATARLLDSARRLTDEPPYASREAREADIAAGAGRSVADLVADVAGSAAALRATALALPGDQWEAVVTVAGLDPFPKSQVLVRRLVELELHHVDLDAGYTAAQWPAAFVALDLPEPLRIQRAERLSA
jgi:maleylpyruvate isomerase